MGNKAEYVHWPIESMNHSKNNIDKFPECDILQKL